MFNCVGAQIINMAVRVTENASTFILLVRIELNRSVAINQKMHHHFW